MNKSKKIISTLGSYMGYKSIKRGIDFWGGGFDIDGNEYTSVLIGDQEWMVENLKTTTYNDGVGIPNITDGGEWLADTDGAYCWYDNDIGYKTPYGGLYNRYAVINVHGLAPVGWKIPDLVDVEKLMAAVGGLAVAGGNLKEVGLVHWDSPNTGATDAYGFCFLPGGTRNWGDGMFWMMGSAGDCWIADYLNMFGASCDTTTGDISGANAKDGFNVRCMRYV